MKEEIIHLSEHLKGLTDGERTILWQALTIDILGRMLKDDNDELDLVFGVAPFGDQSHTSGTSFAPRQKRRHRKRAHELARRTRQKS